MTDAELLNLCKERLQEYPPEGVEAEKIREQICKLETKIERSKNN
jgi:hypothetical protein